MLRFLVGGLILSTFRRTSAAQSHNTLHSRAVTSTCRNLNIMENPFEKMSEEGVPKTDKPTVVAAPKQAEQDLPKLSSQEFKVFNRMAEHMDMFVRPTC